MRMKTLLLACAVFSTSLAQAEDRLLPSDVCYPAVQALQEPSTEANLTPYDPFAYSDHIDASAIPNAEPTTMAMAMIILKEIGKVVGTKIYESIFKDGSKRTLTEADFKRISEVVKEALREDAKRKINNCVISLQNTAKELATEWDTNIATDAYTTSGAVVDTIYHFDHLYSKVALLPSAMLIGSLRAGIAQEFLIRDANKTDKLFFSGVERLLAGLNVYKDQVNKDLLDINNNNVLDRSEYFRPCGNSETGHAYCMGVQHWFWGKLAVNVSERCELSREDCEGRFVYHRFEADHLFITELVEMEKAVFHAEGKEGGYSIQAWEEKLKNTPARQPMVNRVKISSPRPNK